MRGHDDCRAERVRMSDGAELFTCTSRRTQARDAPAVVLIHGGPGLWDYLGPVAWLLDDVPVVHRYDQRGCGRSSVSDDLSMTRYIADIEDYADTALGLEASRVMAQTPLDINDEANRRVTFSDADQLRWASQVKCPVFFVHGSADPRPARYAMDLASASPHARWRIIDGAGHLPWVERPDEVRDLLHEVIRAAD